MAAAHLDVDLTPQSPNARFCANDGGNYEFWLSAHSKMLKEARVGASRFSLNPRGLLMPKYSDSNQIFYVLEVFCVSETRAKASNLENSLFTPDFIAQAWDVPEETVNSQKEERIVLLKEGISMPETTDLSNSPYGEFAYNCEEAKLDVDIKNGGRVSVVSSDSLPIFKHVSLGADLVKLDPHAMCSPGFSSDSAYQVTYIVRGSGRVQVVNQNGERVIDHMLEPGCLFIVPRFHVVSKRAGENGMEWFSIITTEKPVFSHLAGRTGVIKSLSPKTICAAFNVEDGVEKELRSRRTNDAIFFPPK
ncbi:11S globulin seed storage protein 2 [Selaginella moellendorffii]|uniref:11S globulin seed storage protein 2 n=1 Tax=Selaginella moellendorffii TaxID=88036 RepID=UPI000D1D118B|nr:11S globulin seed storage protein 2 [Selaginella moellendorffii]|eukprot:XP_024541015.1 11S globulin seed storage protein 2 [Selaginella moellendorffii]